MLLNIFHAQGHDGVAGVWKSAILDEKELELMAVTMGSKKMREYLVDDDLLSTFRLETVALFLTGCLSS